MSLYHRLDMPSISGLANIVASRFLKSRKVKFSLSVLKATPAAEIPAYLKQTCRLLSDRGGGRLVYKLGNGLVLKLAKRQRDTNSNRSEQAKTKSLPGNLVLNPVIDADASYLWAIYPQANSVTNAGLGAMLEEATDNQVRGLTELQAALLNLASGRYTYLKPNKWVEDLIALKISPYEMFADNWGHTSKGLVLVDYE